MVMAYIWTGMVLTAVLFSFWSGTGAALSQAVLEGAQSGVTLTLSMAGAVCLWSGVGRVMECAGLNRILARGLEPVIGRLFPSARKDPKVGELVSANVCANLLGLGNAATPMGIAATQRMSRYAKPGGSQSRNVPAHCHEYSVNSADSHQCGGSSGGTWKRRPF